jgi:signal transduction histidine kinase
VSVAVPPESDLDEPNQRLLRLERRVARERAARLAAEQIAEEQTRRLWTIAGDLERVVALRTAELAAARDAAERANAVKSAVLARLGHLSMSPVHVALGLVELELRETGAEAAPRLRTVATTLQELHRLFRNLHVVAEADAGTIEVTTAPVDVVALAEGSVGLLRQAALRRGILLVTELPEHRPAPVVTDAMRLSHLLDEVLGSVVRKARPGRLTVAVLPRAIAGRIGVRVEARATAGLDRADRADRTDRTAWADVDLEDLSASAVERLAAALGARLEHGQGACLDIPPMG